MLGPRVVLGIGAVAFVGHGLLCLFQPETIARESGLVLPSPAAVTEVRAEYGGLPVALGLFFAFSALHASRARTGLVVLVTICTGYALVRVASLLLQPEPDDYNLQAASFETFVALLGAFFLFRHGGSRSS